LALAEQAGRADLAQFEGFAADDLDPDRLSEADRFLDTGIEGPQAPLPNPFRYDNERAFAASYSPVVATIEDAQLSSSA
jgi:hypothetical protein